MYVQNFTNEEDRRILEKLYRENRQSYYYTARKVLTDDLEAEQAVYDGFQLLVSNFGVLRDLDYRSLEQLAFVAIRNEAKRAAVQKAEKKAAQSAVINPDEMKAALLKLPEEERDILLLRFAMHLEAKQIGIFLQIPEDQINAIIHKNSQSFGLF